MATGSNAPTLLAVEDVEESAFRDGGGRYSSIVARMESTLALKKTERFQASDADRILILDAEMENLREAIELFKRAESVAPELTQFGGPQTRNMRIQLPPASAEYHFTPLQFRRYTYQTAEPVEICYLRELIASGRSAGLREMAPGLTAAVSQDGELINFYPDAMIEDLGRAHVLKSQIG